MPDATQESVSGDYSMLMHQHITYFTKDSLRHTILEAGLQPLSVQRAGYGGSLYAIARVSNEILQPESQIQSADSLKYCDRAREAQERFFNLFEFSKKNSSRILCYVPLRALPYLASIGELNNENIKFIDDTPFWKNNVIDGTSVPIQPLEMISTNRSDSLFIFSNTFDEVIKEGS